jgi:hypothetical protein
MLLSHGGMEILLNWRNNEIFLMTVKRCNKCQKVKLAYLLVILSKSWVQFERRSYEKSQKDEQREMRSEIIPFREDKESTQWICQKSQKDLISLGNIEGRNKTIFVFRMAMNFLEELSDIN